MALLGAIRGLALLCALLPAVASALDPARSIDQLHHSGWTAKDGAPSDIYTMAQTTDGWLWLGGPGGLFRFDGMHFEKIDPLPPDQLRAAGVSTLNALPNGDLWITYLNGGATRLHEGAWRYYDQRDGVPAERWMASLEVDAEGRIWAADEDLRLFDGERWIVAGEDWGVPPLGESELIADASGALWLANDGSLLVKKPGATRFEAAGDLPKGSRLLVDAHGSLLLRERDDISRLRPAVAGLSGWRSPVSDSAIRLLDRDGSLWSVSCASGICRTPQPWINELPSPHKRAPAEENFDIAQGLTSGMVLTVLEDSQGAIWVSTKRGIDRFRNVALVRAPMPPGLVYFSVNAAAGGAVDVGTDSRGYAADGYWRINAAPQRIAALPGVEQSITCQYRAPDGTLWIGGRGRLTRVSGQQTTTIAMPLPQADLDDIPVQALVVDAAGDLWMSLSKRGLFRLHQGQWQRNAGRSDLPDTSPAVAVRAPDSSLWFGYADNTVLRLHGDALRRYGKDDGLVAGSVTAIHLGRHTLVAGDLGLNRLAGERFVRMQAQPADVLDAITGIVETAQGDLWLNGSAGVVHVAADTALAADAPLAYRLFDSEDGLPGTAQQVRPLPTAIAGSDGRLWFAATEGLVWLDPRHITDNPQPPSVSILGIKANGQDWRGTGLRQLPPLTPEVEIDYTAPYPLRAERQQFRYRLHGIDHDWREAGHRRAAFYTNLAPGRYRFQVIAANESGVWNEVGASMEFELLPAFYQTWWFRSLCALALLALFGLLFHLRMLRLAMRMRSRIHERHAERERIARELHDTLLQGVQGLILRFQAVTQKVTDTRVRGEFERALERADSVLIESRDRVQGLRQNADDNFHIETELRSFGEQLALDHGVAFRIDVSGTATGLDPAIMEELYWIAREALTNAFTHAAAQTIDVGIEYTARKLSLHIRDDGRGFDTSSSPAGHFGVRGMHERARHIHAQLHISSQSGKGTRVDISLRPAKRRGERQP